MVVYFWENMKNTNCKKVCCGRISPEVVPIVEGSYFRLASYSTVAIKSDLNRRVSTVNPDTLVSMSQPRFDNLGTISRECGLRAWNFEVLKLI